MTTTKPNSSTTGASVQETSTDTATQQPAYYMDNNMKFAFAPSTPPPAADMPFTFTHVAHDGTKTSTTFDPNSKPSAPKWTRKEFVPAQNAKKDDGERTLVLKKRGGGRGGRGGRGAKA